MKKFTFALPIMTAGFLFASVLSAQDAPAPKPKSTPDQTNPSTKTPGSATTTKPRTGPKTGAGTATTPKTPAPLALTTQKDKVSYAIGLNIGRSLHKDSVDVDPAIFMRGLKDALAGGKILLTDDEMRTVMTGLQAELRKKQDEQLQQASAANKQAGDAFLAANKTKEGIVTLPSGLQYKILKEGTGPKPAATDTVMCNYRGTLLDSKEFDSSYKRGQPAAIPVSGVIKGWTEALQLMPVGSKWQLFIPPDLAYGNQAAGPDIGPGSTLIFEVELLSIQEKPASQQTPPSQEKPPSK
jgi:FKBP-type peptidyl-prolyl cis-trans isomerase FklB